MLLSHLLWLPKFTRISIKSYDTDGDCNDGTAVDIKRAWNEQRKKVLRFGSFRVIKNWKSELIVIILRIQLRKIDIFSGFKINKIQIKKSLGKCKMKLFYCQNKWRISVSTYAILATTLKTLARCRLYATFLKFAMIFCVCYNKNTTLKTIIIRKINIRF